MNARRFMILVGLLALVLIVAFNFGYIHQFGDLIQRVRWYVLPIVLLVQGFGYYANAKYYQAIFEILGYSLPAAKLYETALAINFVNQAFPSGGVSGASFLSRSLDEDEVTAGKAALAQLGRYVFTFLSFLIVLTVGFVLLMLSNSVTHVTVRLLLLFLMVVIFASILVLTIINERSKLESVVLIGSRWVNQLSHRLSRHKRTLVSHDVLNRFIDEFYEGFELLKSKPGLWRRPLMYTLLGNVAEVLTVYVVFLAFGSFINPGVVIAGYTLANIISVVSVFTSGAGLFEATMVGAYAALGVPFALSLSVVIVYRALNFIIFLPLGFRYYRKHL